MAKTNVVSITTEPKPLTSAEAEQGRTNAIAAAQEALARGDEKAWLAQQDRIRFFAAAAEHAIEVEQREAEEQRRREREALKPEAEEAARALDPEVFFASLIENVRDAARMLIVAYPEAPKLLEEHNVKRIKALDMCQAAHVPATHLHTRFDEDALLTLLRRAIYREIYSADLRDLDRVRQVVPDVALMSRQQLGRWSGFRYDAAGNIVEPNEEAAE